MMAAWMEDRNIPLPGGEAFNQFSARVSAFLDELKKTPQEATLLLITHAGPIREIIRLALGLPAEGHWYFQVDNASLSELSLTNGQPVLVYLNDTHHLGEGAR
jgi:broad specificity phosphatase PhoE